MDFLSVIHSDIGIKKNTNQDSVLIKEAITDYGRVLVAIVCDGMGGLSKGEVASATLIRAFSSWFEKDFPAFLYENRTEEGLDRTSLEKELSQLVFRVNAKIAEYGSDNHVSLGTTVAFILFVEGRYYILNIGDSRVYKRTDTELNLLTKDQTFVQNEIDQGRLTPEEAKTHPQRNVLLQCVGASEVIVPEFESGEYCRGELYMICSDGFRHLITEEEFCKIMVPENLQTEKELQDAAVYCTELNKSRLEKDNISVVLVKIC